MELPVEPMRLGRLVDLAAGGGAGRAELAGVGGGVVVVELEPCSADPAVMAALPVVIVGLGEPDGPGAGLVDVAVADAGAATEVVAAVRDRPMAATALALLLRGADRRDVEDGFVAESATYSLLQAGPEHLAWLDRHRQQRQRRSGSEGAATRDESVLVERTGDRLRLTLNRPDVRNALDAGMRDALLDALTVASADAELQVVIDGAGPSFCSGGDLDEFGTLADPASAHLLRLGRSLGHALYSLADRTTVEVHGPSAGSGCELAAFAARVVATPDATFALPEVTMGLVPGAGGTVSITRRIGRHRTAWLALTGTRIDADQALRWGLFDEIR